MEALHLFKKINPVSVKCLHFHPMIPVLFSKSSNVHEIHNQWFLLLLPIQVQDSVFQPHNRTLEVGIL